MDSIVQAGLLNWTWGVFINAIILYIASKLLSEVNLESFGQAFVLAAMLYFLNMLLGDWLKDLAEGMQVLTLGLINLVVDAVLLLIAANLMSGFRLKNFGWALALALFIALAHAFLGNPL